MKLIPSLLIAAAVFLSSCTSDEFLDFRSPNDDLRISLLNASNESSFLAVFKGDTLLKKSTLGLMVNGIDFTRDVVISELSSDEFDETWETVNGKQKLVRNHYNEYQVKVSKLDQPQYFYELVVRIYDKGFAYQYVFSKDAIGDSLQVEKELTELNFQRDFDYWAYNHEHHNLGPIRRSAKRMEKVEPPFVMQFSSDSFLAIHEGAILDLAPFSINASSNTNSLQFNTSYSSQSNAFSTSWRAFMLGERVGDLVVSDLLVNLNEPNKIEDTSWIKPGRSMWDWRVWGYTAEDGFVYGPNTESHKRMIEFASENNVQYMLIDADWYGSEFSDASDPTTSEEGIDIVECMEYAKAKNIGIILYLNDIGAKKFGLERVLKQFSDWGAKGVKYGFMKGTPEDKVEQTRKVVELCAKYKLMVDFHDSPIAPSGDRRTYPNLVTKEFGHSQSDAKRSYFPETAVNQPLINMIAGPLDLCNGWFSLNSAHIGRSKVFEEIPGTVVAEVAKLITVYTGWAVLPDSPEEYKKKDDLFEIIRRMPGQYDSFKVLDAKLDEYVSIIRQSGDDWFIGSLTNREARTLTLDFGFLPEGGKYKATLYKDAADSHFLENKESYTIKNLEVDSESKLEVKLAAGGGHAVHLVKMN
jgi:alpha-glucosidase